MADEMQSPEEAGAERESVPNDAQTVPNAPGSPTARGDTSRTAKGRALEEVGDLSDFPEGSHKVVKVGGRQIGIFNIRGEFYGLPNVCPHQTGPLCEAKIVSGTLIATQETGWKSEWVHDGEIIVCPWHGLEYHVPTGKSLAYPNIRLRRYEVIVENDKVKVRL
jgi:nitrite reductase/ring-hydroxylating ferredoxin subunit